MSESERDTGASEHERFPALARLGRRERRVPYVQQTQHADCGAACLAMVLGYHGRHVTLDEAREATGGSAGGTDARAIVDGAEWFGLRGRGLRIDVGDLDYVPRGAILHWGFNHFVVFDRVRRRGIEIVDPASGRRFVPMERVRTELTGVVLILEPTDEFEPAARDTSRLWWYLRHLLGQRHVISRVVVTSLLLRLFALAVPLLTALVVDRVVPRSDVDLLTVVAIGLGVMLVFQFVSTLMRAHLMLQLRTNLDTRLTLGFVDYMADLPYAFFQRRSAGDLMMRVNSNSNIRDILTTNTLTALLDGALVLAYLVLIVVLSPILGAIVAALGVVQVAVYLASRRRYHDLMAQNLESQARTQSYLVQVLAGMETLKAAGAEHRAVERWSNLFVDELNVSLERSRLQALVDSLLDLLRVGSPLVVLAVGAVQVIDGAMSLGTMLAVNAMAVGLLTPLGTLVANALQLQLLGGYLERIDDVLHTEPEQDRGAVVRAPPLSGAIRLDEVAFRYHVHGPLVVRDVSLEIDPGATVAIVGASGSGKSTLAALLAGLYRPVSGRIFYDGHDLAALEARSLRRQLGIVTQHPYLFGASIRDNIALARPDAHIDEVIAAARLAGVHDEIEAMAMGYETVLADGGASLSGGQRQRLAIARALLTKPSILLLDEATSSLDAVTERRVVDNLRTLRGTRVVIAHRLSTIADADVIVVMEGGRIVEHGTHAELLGQSGAYAALVASQAYLDHARVG